MFRILFLTAVLALASLIVAQAADKDEDTSVTGSEEMFSRAREIRHPGEDAFTVEEAIEKFFPPDGEVDEGTYPLSEASEHSFDIRREKPEKVAISGRAFFRYSDDAISSVEKYEKEFEFNLSYGDWDGYFRFSDLNTFAKNNDRFKWEKASLRYKHGDTKLTVGSFSALFGRGLALNAYEDRIVEHDNELEGIKVEQRWGESQVTALWGQRRLRDNPADSEVSAARIVVPAGKDLDLGVDVVNVEFPDPLGLVEPANMLDYQILGADINARAGDVSIVAEGVQLDRDQKEYGSQFDIDGKDGNGYYINASYAVSGFSLAGEYKHYEGIAHPFMVAPPVKRWFENASADPNDEEGWAAEMAFDAFDDGSQFLLRYGQTNLLEGNLPHHEFYGSYTSKVQDDFSWIGEVWEVNKYLDKHSLQRITLNKVMSEDFTTTASIENERIKPSFGDSYTDNIYIAELAYRSEANVNYILETSGDDAGGKQTAWRAWEFRYRPDENQEWNLLLGTRRDGFVCSGGVCRLEPAFDGAKLDYLLRF